MENIPKSKHDVNEINQEEIDSPEDLSSNWSEMVSTFDELQLEKNLLRGIYGYGFEQPTQIQQSAILPIIKGKDVIAQAQSGFGKTGAFVIGSLQRIDPSINEVQVVVLSPTRDLAIQSYDVYRYISEFMKLNIALLIGGTRLRENIKTIESGAHIVIGTAGRVIDLLKKKVLKLTYLKNLILDEADKMLEADFLENMKETISCIPEESKILLFSATMPKEILQLTKFFMKDPARIILKNEEVTLKGIQQFYVTLKKEWKVDTLIQLYKGLNINQAIIFCNSKRSAELVAEELNKKGHMISLIHGELPMPERNKVMKEFRLGASRVLVSTNLTARGIDVPSVNVVINYDIPNNKETYIHRIGRSGRLGKKGIAINFVTPDEKDQLMDIIKFYESSIDQLPTDLSEIKN